MKTQPIDKKKSDKIAIIVFVGVILILAFGESLIDGLFKLIYGL
jgi:hypothetical protein